MPKEDLARCMHDDVKHGFVIAFPDRKPDFEIAELESKVNEMIKADLSVTYKDNNHVSIGDLIHPCTGPRIHVTKTGMIKNFKLLNHFIYDELNKRYLLIGCVGEGAEQNLQKLDEHQKTRPVL